MALGSYQLISRIRTGQPFGDGTDGALTISADTEQDVPNNTASGAAAGTTLTVGDTDLANGDLILIIQSMGTGSGQWEINEVASGGGTVNITTTENLNYAYSIAGNDAAQYIKIFEYTDVTVDSTKIWDSPKWNSSFLDGILTFAANGTTTITGTINQDDNGFVGGVGAVSFPGWTGQGGIGPSLNQRARNGAGGGGFGQNSPFPGGGGGGYGTVGQNGDGTTPGIGGLTDGNAELTDMTFGGSGGSGRHSGGQAGRSGGMAVIFAKDITVAGLISSDGGTNSVTPLSSGDGGGSGGAILIQAETAAMGTNKVHASKGAGGVGTDNDGGDGGVGRIAVHYGTSVSGSSVDPSFNSYENSNLIESLGTSDRMLRGMGS